MFRGASGRRLWATLRHAFVIPRDPDLTEQQRQHLHKIADKVVQRGLTYPALLVLEGAEPLSYVGAQAVAFFKPVVSVLFPPLLCDEVIALLERRGTAKFLARAIERREAERRTAAGQDGGER